LDEKKKMDELINIGIALASEKRLDKLLDTILREARHFTYADAGSLYLREGNLIRFVASQTESLEKRLGEQKARESFITFTMPISTANIAGYVASTGQILNLEDVYNLPPDVPFSFNKDFDKKSTYRSKSMLVVPMMSQENEVVGVIQLINSTNDRGEAIPFLAEYEKLTFSLASQAAVAVQMAQMREDLKASNMEMIERLSVAAEFRDEDTALHIKRMSLYSEILARHMGFSEEEVELILFTSPMHDIGKLGVPDSILLKPAKLTDEEFQIMKNHTIYGAQILKNSKYEIIRKSEVIAISHHEKWNGNGYPYGLAGEEIPVEGRIVAIADVFDALSSKRCYKPAFPIEKVVDIIKKDTGTHFDPSVTEAFFHGYDDIMKVYDKYKEV
jgi:HD-GYP domain-containing protein (c-di-GMP phosphodiesterase class II)